MFGEVIKGKSVVRRIENHSTTSGDAPTVEFTIAECGTLEPDDPSLKAEVSTAADPYEDYPDDDDRDVSNHPEISLQAAKDLKALGNEKFKAGDVQSALDKWQSTRLSFHLCSST